MAGIDDKQRLIGRDARGVNRGKPPAPTAKADASVVQTADKHRSTGDAARAVDRGGSAGKADAGTIQTAEPYSEFGKISAPDEAQKKTNTIEFDKRNLSIGRARYEGATHLSKNVAVLPHYGGGGADLMNHLNVEVHLYDQAGKEVRMTDRYFREWAFEVKDPKTTIATLKVSDLKVLPGSGGRFYWETPSATDAPGQQNIIQGRTYVYLQEFITGNPKAGGFYFQNVTMLDPDGTTRIMVKNKLPLTPGDFQTLTQIVADPNFVGDYQGKFVIGNLPNKTDSDSGVDRSIPDNVQKKKEAQQKKKAPSP